MRGDVMKNNIILILAVTVISIGIIIASILISANGSGSESENSGQFSSSGTSDNSSLPQKPDTSEVYFTYEVPQRHETSEPDTGSADEPPAPPQSDVAQGVISTARSLIGIDFTDGGDSPDAGFDNSGFIYYVLRENGYITCPRGVAAQSEMGTAVEFDKLQAGDLAFFYNDDMATVGFGGIYCGGGNMIACLMPGTTVREINIDSDYYRSHFCRGVGLN